MFIDNEGIEIETLDPENQGVVLPDESKTDENNINKKDVINEKDVDVGNESEDNSFENEKEYLKKGVNYERNLRKQAEKKNKELEKEIQKLKDANKTPTKTTTEELIESGVDEEIAKKIGTAIDKKSKNSSNVEQELADLKFKYSLSEVSKKDGFDDIEEYADEIKDLVDKGLTVEQSYYALTGGKSKSTNTKREIERNMEVKLENKQARKEILGNINSNIGATSKTNNDNKSKASAEEIAIAKAAGMSIEDYLAVKEMDNIKSYENYTKNKK